MERGNRNLRNYARRVLSLSATRIDGQAAGKPETSGGEDTTVRRAARGRVFAWGRLLAAVAITAASLWALPGSLAKPRLLQNAAAAIDPVIAAAGDIACDPASSSFNGGLGTSSNCRQKYTSDLLVNMNPAAVLDLGDNQYYCGGLQAFLQSYDLSWGRVKAITYPSVGNHEYLTSGGTGCDPTNTAAAGYFNYFGAAAGTPGQGWYSYDVGTWHLIALNSNCSDAGGCASGSPQYTWLQADLAAHTNFCTLAYWHIPLYSSGGRAASNSRPFWTLLYNYNADLVLNGHDHIYERFAPQTPTGTVDNTRGLREIIAGTGGSDHTSISVVAANSQVRDTSTFGVLKLTLHPTSYDWQFVPEAGKTFTDAGTGVCHGSTPDTTPPSAPADLTATSVAWNQVTLGWTPSTDNIGVVGYQIFRNGVQIGTTAGTTSYTDSTVQPQTTYSYYAVAVDGADLTSGPSNTASVTTPAAPSVLTFGPAADTYIGPDVPDSNFGTSSQVVVDNSPVRETFLKFTVSGVSGRPVSTAKLRLYCVNGSGVGGEFHRVANSSWTEAGLTLNNAPAADSTVLGRLGAVAANAWYEMDVTSLITGDGTFSLMGLSSSADGAYYSTKEGTAGFAAQLVVTVGSGEGSTATPTPTSTPTTIGGPTATWTPTATATLPSLATNTPTPTPTTIGASTATPTATATNTPTATLVPTNTPTSTPASSPTPVPPDTTITSGPSGFVSSTGPNFSFTSTVAGASFMCSLDGSPFGACSSPTGYSALTDGSHTFQVYSISPGGIADGTPASRSWTIDMTAPTGVAISAPTDGSTVPIGQVRITAVASDNNGVASVKFYVDGQLLATDTSAPYAATWNTRKSTAGPHTLYVIAADAAGNVTQSATITVARQ